ncbi:hypothetical protein CYMTET_55999 [Cymbomonas tetramitiformis]|uniref:Uncharacterized protein n=1 Tax=Cymbomonas tetramitiformis TaxID=36881 RepID=A0AAE0BC62_9CHLO|nr:hypothetical protein CYMTET_55999 [Cymbomonas tetramitiformis]
MSSLASTPSRSPSQSRPRTSRNVVSDEIDKFLLTKPNRPNFLQVTDHLTEQVARKYAYDGPEFSPDSTPVRSRSRSTRIYDGFDRTPRTSRKSAVSPSPSSKDSPTRQRARTEAFLQMRHETPTLRIAMPSPTRVTPLPSKVSPRKAQPTDPRYNRASTFAGSNFDADAYNPMLATDFAYDKEEAIDTNQLLREAKEHALVPSFDEEYSPMILELVAMGMPRSSIPTMRKILIRRFRPLFNIWKKETADIKLFKEKGNKIARRMKNRELHDAFFKWRGVLEYKHLQQAKRSGMQSKVSMFFLKIAAYMGSMRGVDYFFNLLGADAMENLRTWQNKKGRTLIHLAVLDKNKQMFDYWLKQGISVQIMDKDGMSPLHLACQLGLQGMAEALVVAGLDPATPDRKGRRYDDPRLFTA